MGLSIGQVKVDEKLNEITAIPELLELLDITNAHITIDAIGTQEKITKKIVKKCGHYVFKVKENQRELQKDIRRYFDKINNLKAHKDIIWKEVSDKKNHGRIEKKNYYLSYDVNSIKDKKKWETIKGIAYVRVQRTIREETSITDNYYIIGSNNSKEYLELNSVPLIAKVTMKKNTLLTTELLSKGDNQVQDDVRKQEYNMIVLPIDLVTGDYVDIRVMFPNGQDFIVVAKKEVEIPTIGTADSEDTIWMNLSEDEILHMSCAIVDSAQVKGAKIYATKYTEAGMQKAATPTYPINESTSKLLQSDPNILEKAMTEIRTRYGNGNSAEIRNNYINSSINNQGEQAQSNLETKMEESVTNSKNSRKEYLDSLSGTTTE